MTKFACLVVLYLTVSTTGFTVTPSRSISALGPKSVIHSNSFISLTAAKEDDYDAWLDQLDPAAFESDEDDNFGSGRGRGRSNGQSRSFPKHDYERDWRADRSNVNEPEVDRLLTERLQARKTGQFDKADRIRDELLEVHGVAVKDRERQWRSGCSVSGSGSKWGRGDNNNNNNDRFDNRRGGGDRDRERGRGRRDDRFQNNNNNDRRGGDRRPPKTNFGPNGHDYDLAPDAGPNTSRLEIGEIHQMIADRLQCKLNRDFRQADIIQNELFQNGVFVHDGYKLWRSDGAGFGQDNTNTSRGGKPGTMPGSRADMNRAYEMSQYSLPLLSTEDMDPDASQETMEAMKAKVQELVDERLDARMNRDFNVADTIREELKDNYNVFVDDRLREWAVGGVFEPPPGMSPYSLPLSSLVAEDDAELDEDSIRAKIQSMVEERFQAKAAKDYRIADEIREDLRDLYNVEVDDRERLWSIGGVFQPPPEPYTISPFSEPLAGIDEEQINEMLLEREAARKERAFAVADDILFTLREDYGVMVSDDRREWSVGGAFGPKGDTSTRAATTYQQRGSNDISPEEKTKIELLIDKRTMHKSLREFDQADDIREMLQAEYNVKLDDRNREWHIVTSDYAHVPSEFQPDDQAIEFIKGQMSERTEARVNGDFERADVIRDSLMDEFGVAIDDRLKEWTVVVNPNSRLAGPIDESESSFAEDSDAVSDEQSEDIGVDAEAGESNEEDDDEWEYEEEWAYEDESEEEKEEEELVLEAEEDETEEEEDEADAEPQVMSAETADEGMEDESAEAADLDDMKVVDLKEILRSKGLPVSGKKSELIERIRGN